MLLQFHYIQVTTYASRQNKKALFQLVANHTHEKFTRLPVQFPLYEAFTILKHSTKDTDINTYIYINKDICINKW